MECLNLEKKIRLCVLFGGQSPEHDISCKSVVSILNNLNEEKYKIHKIGITKKGEWLLYTGKTERIADGSWLKDKKHLKKAIISPDAKDGAILVFDENKVKKIKLDVVFPVLHGEHGEDGTVQGLLELANLKYVGMGVLSSANSMDKTMTKIVLQSAGIPQANWVTVNTWELEKIEESMNEIETKLGYPCFVKPATTGSSVGVGKAHDRQELKDAILYAAKFARKILVEENIDGREVECSVLGNENPKAGEVGEIIPMVEFYDFDAKYVTGATKLQIPAEIPAETREKIREYAITAFRAMDGSGLSRVDFFIRHSDGAIILNELNTMPGFTSISMYPKLWQAMGLEYAPLLDQLIALGLQSKKQ